MLKRHEDQVWARLDELYVRGTTYMSWNEIYHWYNIRRISKLPWRDIQARWEELLDYKEEDPVDLRVAKTEGGISLFFAQSPSKLSELAK